MPDKCWFKWYGAMPKDRYAFEVTVPDDFEGLHHCDRTYQHNDEFHQCKCGALKIQDANKERDDGSR